MKLLKNYKTKYLKLKKYNKTQNKLTNQTGGSLPSIAELEYANYILENPDPINSDTILKYLSTNTNRDQPIKIDVNQYKSDHRDKFINDDRAVYYLILIALMHSNGVIPYLNFYIQNNIITKLYLIDYQNLVSQLKINASRIQNDITRYANNHPDNLYLYIVADDKKSQLPVKITNNVIKITLYAKKINKSYDTIHSLKYNNNDELNMGDVFTKNLHRYLINMNIILDNADNDKKIYINESILEYFSGKREKYFYNVRYNYQSNLQDNSTLIPYFEIHKPADNTRSNEYNSIDNVTNDNLDILYINEFDKNLGFGANSIDDILLFMLGSYIYKYYDDYKKSKINITVVSNDKFKEFSGTFIDIIKSNQQYVHDFAIKINHNYSSQVARSYVQSSAKRGPTQSGRPSAKKGGGGYKIKMTKKLNKYKSTV